MKAKKMGRPKTLTDGRKCVLYLEQATLDLLTRLGDGVPSKGVRTLIDFHTKITVPVLNDIKKEKKG